MHKVWPLIIASLFMLSSAVAVGIAPATISTTIKIGEPQQLTFYAVNNGAKEIEVEAYADGDLSQYITFSEKRFKVQPGVLRPFTVTINVPANISAGRFAAAIGVFEVTSAVSESGLSAKVAAQSTLTIENPNGSIILKLSISAANVTMSGQPAYFYIKLENPTPYPVGPVQGQLLILDSGHNEIDSSTLTVVERVGPNNATQMTGVWSDTVRGKFVALVNITYAGQSSAASADFQVGKPLVEILSVNVTQNHNRATILIKVQSRWPESMPVSAEVRSYYKGVLVGTAKSNSIMLDPDSQGILSATLDLMDWNLADLDFDVLVFYSGYMTQQKVTAEGYVQEYYAGPPLGSAVGTKSSLNIKPTYIAAVLLIIMAFILLSFYRREGKYGR